MNATGKGVNHSPHAQLWEDDEVKPGCATLKSLAYPRWLCIAQDLMMCLTCFGYAGGKLMAMPRSSVIMLGETDMSNSLRLQLKTFTAA